MLSRPAAPQGVFADQPVGAVRGVEDRVARSPTVQASVLTALLWPSCAAGGAIGAIVGVIGGSIGDTSGGWASLGWGFVGTVVGIAVGALLLGWVWAVLCRRLRSIPAITLAVLAGGGAAIGLPLILAVPGSDNDLLRVVLSCAILLVVTAATFLVGRSTPARHLSS